MTMPTARFPLGPFTPSPVNPILQPHGDGWESANLYNPAAIIEGDEVVLLYRAHAADKISRIGMARSRDGIHFERLGTPVLEPEQPYEQAGCEDPRITRIDGTYYLTYTGFDGTTAQLCLATSTDLHTWTRHGPLFPGFNTWRTLPYGPDQPWSKAGVIHPEPIEGRYWMWYGEGALYAATSTDLLHWTPVTDDQHPLYVPTPGAWDGTLVEIGAPPVETEDGLLVFLINNATATSPSQVHYQCGQIAVARRDPATVLAKMTQPWLRPHTHEDTHGLVPNVTFVEGLVHFQGRWLAYYGQSDTTLAVAVHDPAEQNWRTADRTPHEAGR
ncbi:glycoside hydrolase family 130 protein [Streptomyces sp. NPDC058247]|uniref:glycoside hydrolase family 130 protein n=1 Tax=Streptomyces sp. NPDC058247 TaxID=3346401 RepID=UPI0036ECADC3